ncbi:hypothetical protein FISHEDRAFT_39509 [Fistulina hepatica ATCC 64428]|uniref:Non-ribosomal peptide synthetase n=1 Tax=Fistulina hepatica ATCC 64428 TaxID=1128425 RepID=A0A0D7AGN2_9AGAR|nr:hypothetical protein FISHEDRAFT_39509 [Fistulina hepatica ATCC 64428]
MWLRFQVYFTLYKRFFTIILTMNLIGITTAGSGHWQYPRHYTGAFILGNLVIAVLVRNELFGRILYAVINYFFAKWPPLWFRVAITSTLQHLGGVHSGCAISGTLWLLFKTCLLFIDAANYNPAILVFSILILIALCVTIICALPWLRDNHHNIFERHHRLVGWYLWSIVVDSWIFTVMSDSYSLDTHDFSRASHVIRQQDFWFLLGMTIFIMIPWFTVRRVPVEIEVPSPKVAIVKFKRGMQQGLLARIGHRPVMEYHAFGTISEGPEADCHYLIAGVQGDFTRGLVENPPTHLWTRELKFAAVSHCSTLYRRGVRVCTGTGLGAGLSTCIQNPNWYLIWMGSDQEKTFGPTISGLIKKHLHPGRVTLWDSKARGCRADTVKLILDVCKIWEAEVVIITSNLAGSKEMMEGVKEAGIPAFGTLFDFCERSPLDFFWSQMT